VLAVLSLSSRGNGQFEPEEFFKWCAERMAHFMVPRYVRIVDDLPRGGSGKVQKHELRANGVTAGTWDATSHGLRATRRGVIRIDPDHRARA
jgi:crotonobetaine/carnitine-CoA ligase